MRKFNLSRMAARRAVLLAAGPLALLSACTVYDGVLPAASSSGGSSASGAGTAPGGGSVQGGSVGQAGSEPGAGSDHGGATAGEDAGGSAAVAGGGAGGGSAGAGGGGAAGEPASDVSILDDMEDADAQLNLDAGRNGYWYVGNDGTPGGTQEPTSAAFMMFELDAGERQGSTYSAHMKVSGYTGWGSVIGFNLLEQLGAVKAYDASAYCGVQFWAKAAAATSLRFRLPDGDTHPAGGVCVVTGPADQLCYDHFSAPVALTAAWKSFIIPFSSLEQVGTGYHPADGQLKTDQVYAAEWAIPGAGGKAFEIWIDDAALLKCP